MDVKSKLPEFLVTKALALKKTLIMVIIPLLLLSMAVTLVNLKKGSKPIEVQPNSTITTLMNSSSAQSLISQKIDAKTIDLIVNCGIKAPSAMNQQPWHFCIIQNRKIIERISSEAVASAQATASAGKPAPPKNQLLSHAPVVIIISATTASRSAIFDTALACENMSIAAQSLGLGARIITTPIPVLNGSKAKDYHQLLRIPNDKKPIAALVLGVPDYSPDATGRATSRSLDVISRIR